jgi:hypothetical protein
MMESTKRFEKFWQIVKIGNLRTCFGFPLGKKCDKLCLVGNLFKFATRFFSRELAKNEAESTKNGGRQTGECKL